MVVRYFQAALVPRLRQRLAKQFALAGAIVDEENG
jgi:hypothetical protein